MIRTNLELLEYMKVAIDLGKLDEVEEIAVSRGDSIISQGKKVFAAYIIKQGMVKCYLTVDTGEYFIQEFFGAGELFGEIEMINNAGALCTIEAISNVELYRIKQADFEKLIESDRDFNRLVMKTMASKIHYKALRHSFHQSHDLKTNLDQLLQDFPDLMNTIKKQDIANYMGITLRSLNRILKEMG